MLIAFSPAGRHSAPDYDYRAFVPVGAAAEKPFHPTASPTRLRKGYGVAEQVDGYNVVSMASDCRSSARMRWPRLVGFCIRFNRLDKAAFAAEFMRSIKRIPLR